MSQDQPKSLLYPSVRGARRRRLNDPHVQRLTKFVDELRRDTDKGEDIPYFDPMDGGVRARCLFLLEAPGPKAVMSGFVSRDNPDDTARNFFRANEEVRLPREATVSWNIVPWYVGSGGKIRSVSSEEIREGIEHFRRLLDEVLQEVELVVLVGTKARKAERMVEERWPPLELRHMPHPSPQFINRARKENWQRLIDALREVKRVLRLP